MERAIKFYLKNSSLWFLLDRIIILEKNNEIFYHFSNFFKFSGMHRSRSKK